MKITNTSQCEGCKYATIDKTDKARVTVYCEITNKTRHWGQYVECDMKETIDAD